MKRSDFHFDLPPERIAQQPLERRSDSRLLHLNRRSGDFDDRVFRELTDILRAGDLLVFNNTRVIPARLYAHKASGGKAEILVERLLDDHRCLAQVRASKSPPAGSLLILEDGSEWQCEGREEGFFVLRSLQLPLADTINRLGHMPLPPYIERADTEMDQERYQTVYAQTPGAVAAPTAGLHFDPPLLAALRDQGVEQAFVTLHVGAGTFQPVREERIEDHQMHAEYLEVTQQVCDAVAATRERGGRVIAVGTTAVRSLETAAQQATAGPDSPSGDVLLPFRGDSRIFIYPGYEFLAVDGIITNFHLPESTLLMLVSAFAGMQPIRRAYAHAVAAEYRFFSYGDAMIIV